MNRKAVKVKTSALNYTKLIKQINLIRKFKIFPTKKSLILKKTFTKPIQTTTNRLLLISKAFNHHQMNSKKIKMRIIKDKLRK